MGCSFQDAEAPSKHSQAPSLISSSFNISSDITVNTPPKARRSGEDEDTSNRQEEVVEEVIGFSFLYALHHNTPPLSINTITKVQTAGQWTYLSQAQDAEAAARVSYQPLKSVRVFKLENVARPKRQSACIHEVKVVLSHRIDAPI